MADEGSQIKERVRETASQATDQIQERIGAVGRQIRQATPDSAQESIESVSKMARLVPPPVVVIAVLLIGYFLGRRQAQRARRP